MPAAALVRSKVRLSTAFLFSIFLSLSLGACVRKNTSSIKQESAAPKKVGRPLVRTATIHYARAKSSRRPRALSPRYPGAEFQVRFENFAFDWDEIDRREKLLAEGEKLVFGTVTRTFLSSTGARLQGNESSQVFEIVDPLRPRKGTLFDDDDGENRWTFELRPQGKANAGEGTSYFSPRFLSATYNLGRWDLDFSRFSEPPKEDAGESEFHYYPAYGISGDLDPEIDRAPTMTFFDPTPELRVVGLGGTVTLEYKKQVRVTLRGRLTPSDDGETIAGTLDTDISGADYRDAVRMGAQAETGLTLRGRRFGCPLCYLIRIEDKGLLLGIVETSADYGSTRSGAVGRSLKVQGGLSMRYRVFPHPETRAQPEEKWDFSVVYGYPSGHSILKDTSQSP